MKYLNYFETHFEKSDLPKSINIDIELDKLRKIENMKNLLLKDKNDKERFDIIHNLNEFNILLNKEDIIEKEIRDKLLPVMLQYLEDSGKVLSGLLEDHIKI